MLFRSESRRFGPFGKKSMQGEPKCGAGLYCDVTSMSSYFLVGFVKKEEEEGEKEQQQKQE